MKPKKPGEQPSGASTCQKARLNSSGTDLGCNDGAKGFGTPLGTCPVLATEIYPHTSSATWTMSILGMSEHALQGCLAMWSEQTAVCNWIKAKRGAWH